jgi:hypothetical protein
MYTIFFTINCVKQLTFSKTFVDQMQFEQLIFFLSKSETARNTCTADDFSWFLIFEQLTRKNIIAQMVSSNNKIVSSRFFEQSNFEQMIMTLLFFSLVFSFLSSFIKFLFLPQWSSLFHVWLLFYLFFNQSSNYYNLNCIFYF